MGLIDMKPSDIESKATVSHSQFLKIILKKETLKGK